MRPLIAHIDLSAIQHNYALAKRCAPGREAFAVVKANAYGHGVREVVTALRDEADGFAVACLEEAAEVRALHGTARILLLEGCFEPSEFLVASQLRLDIAVQGPEQLATLLASNLPQPLNVWLKLDSGMHRLGFSAEALRAVFPSLRGAPQVAELNLMSHFACADERGHTLTEDQLECFLGLLDLDFDQRSLANSAAVLSIPAAHMDWIRPGIMLYGASPFADLGAAEMGLRAHYVVEVEFPQLYRRVEELRRAGAPVDDTRVQDLIARMDRLSALLGGGSHGGAGVRRAWRADPAAMSGREEAVAGPWRELVDYVEAAREVAGSRI